MDNKIVIKGEKEPKTYIDRNTIVKSLGFKDYYAYLKSKYWKIIRKEVMKRDNYSCKGNSRCKGNKGNELQVHHVNYARSVLLGINLGCLVTLCRDCHEYCEVSKSGAKYSVFESQQRTFKLLVGERRNPGVNSPSLGNWFRRQYLDSRFYSQNVLRAYYEQDLAWYAKILKELNLGKLPTNFIKYLDLPSKVMLGVEGYKPIAGRKDWLILQAEERKIQKFKRENLASTVERTSKAIRSGKKFWKD